jgi:hypothetical protein
METTEICKDGLTVSLTRQNDRVILQIVSYAEPPEPFAGMVPCEPDVLCAVLRGLTYQIASEAMYCLIRRLGGKVTIEGQTGPNRFHCSMSLDEFGHLLSPIMPPRLRAMLL